MKALPLLLALFSATLLTAQSYYYTVDQGVSSAYYPFSNPGTAILTQPFDDGFSAVQTLPFTWNFYGNPVTQFKASDNGYITFDLPASTSDPSNTAIPSGTGPNHCIYAFWDNLELSNNPSFVTNSVRTYTLGTAPNRVFVVLWNVTPKGFPGNSNYMYFSLRLYEGGDFDLIYQQIKLTTTVSGTAGCENAAGDDATMIAGSPNFTYTGGAYIAANVPVYRFTFGSQPTDDVVLTRLDLKDIAHISETYDIKGEIINQGLQAINSLEIGYQVDGGPVQSGTINGLNILPNESYAFTHPIQWTPVNEGTFQDVAVTVTTINGNPDANPVNNTLSKDVWVNLGISAEKKVLIEEFSTAPCGYCPDGNLILQGILDKYPEVVAFTHHSGYLSDAMTIPASEAIAGEFCPGAPLACVDRVLWPDEIYVAVSRLDWEDRVLESMTDAAPVDIDISTFWNEGTREMDIGVTLDFVDYALPGDLRLNVFVIEDSVTGTGPGYDQINYYNNTPSHFYYQWGNPIIGFVHRHVVRASLTGDWGEATGIPQDADPTDELQRLFTYTVPPDYKEKDIRVVAFVSYDEPDRWQVLNAAEEHLDLGPVGMESIQSNDIYVYPNPATSQFTVQLPEGAGPAEVHLYDVSGRLVLSQSNAIAMTSIDLNGLSRGVYLIKVGGEDYQYQKRLVIQ